MTGRSCFIGNSNSVRKGGLSELQVEQIMKGSYKISEGCGAPEAKIRKGASESKVVG